jgi:hypothetical protein
MPDYQLQIRQLVSYPRCRIYREFLQSLIADRGIRTSGRPGLFCFSVLCSYANFRTSYLRIDGLTYTINAGTPSSVTTNDENEFTGGCAPAAGRWRCWTPCKTATSSNTPYWAGKSS